MRLLHKVALVTGSAQGLGKMTAVSLAESGCDVALNYVHSKQEAMQLVQTIESLGVRCIAVKADITQREQLIAMVDEVQERLGGIDVLVNNAGPFVRERRLFIDYSLDEIDSLIRGNLLAAMTLDHLVLPWMRERKWGRIIHFGFGHAAEARGWPHRAVYAAAKVGLVSFTKTLAVEEAEYGITVNMVCPGDIRGNNKEKTIEQVEHLIDEESPRGRPGTGEDVSRVIAFLCDLKADFFTGNILNVSGGLDPIRSLPLVK
jgi:3-oxoacyl-[acyl-carrier protein] reductase